MDNKDVTIKPGTVTKEVKKMEMKKVVMDFGAFQKTYPKLSEPTSSNTGDKIKKEAGDKDLKQVTNAADQLSESLKKLIAESSYAAVKSLILEMEGEENTEDTPADETEIEETSTEETKVEESKKAKEEEKEEKKEKDEKKKK